MASEQAKETEAKVVFIANLIDEFLDHAIPKQDRSLVVLALLTAAVRRLAVSVKDAAAWREGKPKILAFFDALLIKAGQDKRFKP